MESMQITQEAIDIVMKLPDMTGIARCAALCQLFTTLELLKSKLESEKKSGEQSTTILTEDRKENQNG